MSGIAFAETVDFYRVEASPKLDAKRLALLGQYMTPAPIARFTASLFTETRGDIPVLDPGAGVGSLTAALAERLCAAKAPPQRRRAVTVGARPLATPRFQLPNPVGACFISLGKRGGTS